MTRRPQKSSRPARAAQSKPPAADGAEDLPTLEPIAAGEDELPSLSDFLDAPEAPSFAVDFQFGPAAEAGFDLTVTIAAPDMDKQAMVAAVAAPFDHHLGGGGLSVRHRRVLVVFTGDAIIGSAVRALCEQKLSEHKASRAVVRRGYGDEVLFEHEPPRAKVQEAADGKLLRIEVDASGLEAQDLRFALQEPMRAWGQSAAQKRVELRFAGHKPDAALRSEIEGCLRAAGALAAAIGARVLFDRELEDRVQFADQDGVTMVHVDPHEDDALTEEALAMRLSGGAARLAGKVVRIAFLRSVNESVQACAVRNAAAAGPKRIEVAAAGGVEVVWPALLTLAQDAHETTVRIDQNGRDLAAVRRAFLNEIRDLQAAFVHKRVVVQWPQDLAFDAAAEQAFLEPLAAFGPQALCCELSSGEREVFVPAPVSCIEDGPTQLLTIDTDSGKPKEIGRAFDRWLARHGGALAGASVRIAFVGEAAPARSLQKSALAAVAAHKAARIEVDRDGAIDVVAPALLTVATAAGGVLAMSMQAGDRSDAQLGVALERELEAVAGLAGAVVHIEPAAACERLVEALAQRGVASVTLVGAEPVQVFPPLLSMSRGKQGLALQAGPAVDAAMAQRQVARELPRLLPDGAAGEAVTVTWEGAAPDQEPCRSLVAGLVAMGAAKVFVDAGGGRQQAHPVVVPETVTALGRNDGASPPLLMLGVGLGAGAAHGEAVRAAAQEWAAQCAGRRVLLVGRRDGADVPFDAADPAAQQALAALQEAAAVTLAYGGRDERRRRYFAVLSSQLPEFAVGARFADPRPQA